MSIANRKWLIVYLSTGLDSLPDAKVNEDPADDETTKELKLESFWIFNAR